MSLRIIGPQPRGQPFFDDELHANFPGLVDEDYSFVQAAWVWPLFGQPFIYDDFIGGIPARLDEIYRYVQVQRVDVLYGQPIFFEDGDIPRVARVDEDYSPLIARADAIYPQPISDEFAIATTAHVLDDDVGGQVPFSLPWRGQLVRWQSTNATSNAVVASNAIDDDVSGANTSWYVIPPYVVRQPLSVTEDTIFYHLADDGSIRFVQNYTGAFEQPFAIAAEDFVPPRTSVLDDDVPVTLAPYQLTLNVQPPAIDDTLGLNAILDEDFFQWAFVLPAPTYQFSFTVDESWSSGGSPPGNMPGVVGLDFYQAIEVLQAAGIYLPQTVIAFNPSQITVRWDSNTGLTAGFVGRQIPAQGTTIAPGAPITIFVQRFPFASTLTMPPDWKQNIPPVSAGLPPSLQYALLDNSGNPFMAPDSTIYTTQ